VGVSFASMKKYLELLKLCANSDYETSGIIVSYTPSGGFRYIAYDDLNVLHYKLQTEQQIQMSRNLSQGKNLGL
jgi:hypothetical protein